MSDVHCEVTSGYITGEVKLGIYICLLASGSAHKFGELFDANPDHCMMLFYNMLKNWTIDAGIGNIDMGNYLDNEKEMARVSKVFLQKNR